MSRYIENRYIAIAWYTNKYKKTEDNRVVNEYVLFDTITNKIKILSDEAIKLISSQIINIDYDDYIEHLTTIRKITSKQSRLNSIDLTISYEIKEDMGQKYTKVCFKNIVSNDIFSERTVDTSIVVMDKKNDESSMYNGYILSEYSDISPNSYKSDIFYIIIRKRIGHTIRPTSKTGNFMFKRGFKQVNNSDDVNQQLKNRADKSILLGNNPIDYTYIVDDGIWLVDIDLKQSKTIQIPKCIDYIGFNLTNTFLKLLSSKSSGVSIIMSESQRQSMQYNIDLMSEVCQFGSRYITKEEMKNQLVMAVENNRLIIK